MMVWNRKASGFSQSKLDVVVSLISSLEGNNGGYIWQRQETKYIWVNTSAWFGGESTNYAACLGLTLGQYQRCYYDLVHEIEET